MRPSARATLTAVAVAASLSCSGSSSPTAPAPSPLPSAPVASPSAPLPSPSTTPPVAASCPYGKGTPETFCSRTTSSYLGDVDTAIETLAQQHPDYFNLNDLNGPGGYRVLKEQEYMEGVLQNLVNAGFCVEREGATLQIKKGNDFSEEYDLLLGTGHARRGAGSYRNTCNPAAFPLEASDLIAYVRVAFYSLRCDDGITPPRNGEDKLPIGCTGFITASPKTKDNLDVNERIVGDKIEWTLEQEGEKVRINDFAGQDFNKIAVGINPGHYVLCAEVKAVKGCQYGEVEPDPRK